MLDAVYSLYSLSCEGVFISMLLLRNLRLREAKDPCICCIAARIQNIGQNQSHSKAKVLFVVNLTSSRVACGKNEGWFGCVLKKALDIAYNTVCRLIL